jgi:integrase
MGIYIKTRKIGGKKTIFYSLVVHHKGRRIDRNFHGTAQEAKLAEAQLRVQVLTNTAPTKDQTLASFFESVQIPHASLHLRASTFARQASMRKPVIAALGHKSLADITTVDTEAYARVRLASGLKASSVNNELRFLSSVLNLARKNGHTCPAQIKQLPQTGTKVIKYWVPAQTQRLLDTAAATAPEILPLLTFLANTGCRKGEALWLRWDNIDVANRRIHIEPSEAWQPKSNRGRVIPMATSLVQYLSGPRADATWVFPFEGHSFPRRAFERVLVAAGLKGSPHTLRHSFASAFLSCKPDLFLLAELLGHGDISVTKIYSHLLPEHLNQAIDMVDISAGPAILSRQEAA